MKTERDRIERKKELTDETKDGIGLGVLLTLACYPSSFSSPPLFLHIPAPAPLLPVQLLHHGAQPPDRRERLGAAWAWARVGDTSVVLIHLKGLWDEYYKTEGLFCQSVDDVRPEAVIALLVGKDIVILPFILIFILRTKRNVKNIVAASQPIGQAKLFP